MISSSDIIARSNQHTDSQHLSHLNNYHPQMASYILWVPSTIITAHSDTLIVQEENSPGVTSLCATNRSNLWNQWTLFCIFILTPLSLLLMTLCVPLDIFLEIINLSVTSSVVEIHPTFDSWIFDMVSFPNKCQYGVPWPQEKHIWKKWLPYFPSIKIKFLPRPSPELVQTNTLIYCVTYFSVGLLSPFSTILSPLYMVILYWPPPHFWYQTI